MNVLPSAPPQLYPMQELTQLNAEDFRLKKINDLLKELSDEVEHYRQVAKKYKRSHSMVHASAVGLGSLSVGLSSGALATALTGFGIVASPALAGVATICGLGSVGFAAASKRLERKVTKHEKIYTLAQALFALTELSDMMTKTATMATGEVLPERAWTFKHDFRLWCKEESMWCKREELKQLINFVFVKF